MNSRFFNIRGNAVLQQRILEGSLKASEVASMTHDELADDKVTKNNTVSVPRLRQDSLVGPGQAYQISSLYQKSS